MKKIILQLSILFVIASCGGVEKETNTADKNEDIENKTELDNDVLEDRIDMGLDESSNATLNRDPRTFGGGKLQDQLYIDQQVNLVDNTKDQLLGSYVGSFGKNKINITLTKATEWMAEGFSVCAGNFRKITGDFDLIQDDLYTFTLNEPGDDKYDGVFYFTLNASDKIIEGNWTPFKEKGNTAKTYKLEKRKFKYDPTIGNYPESSIKELSDEDLSNLNENELAEMRNEIYARHGYSFKNKEWRYHFEKLDWYMPMGIDIRDQLTDLEVINIELIYEYETYFEEYYDGFGR